MNTRNTASAQNNAIKRDRENRYTTVKAMADLRRVWFNQFSGNLATIAREDHPLAGYPVGSVVPYVLDDACRPVMLIAYIAEHTQNAIANPKASIFLRENQLFSDVQTQWRLCAIGDLLPLPAEEQPYLSERYFRHYPKARDFDITHKFAFYRLHSKKFRIIMGFGDIRWIRADAPFDQPAFAPEIAERIMTHMNEDHTNAMRTYLQQTGLEIPHDAKIIMTAINAWGCTLKYGDGLHFIAFSAPVTTVEAAREALVALAKN
ncbi:MAG: DUF2470 domain-containing protein [Cardiobacteriaceae bacterium]|nr:DUF2470 domain-containing protein [Cardiobacteriaceae bacterium]